MKAGYPGFGKARPSHTTLARPKFIDSRYFHGEIFSYNGGYED